ncbi:TetR/AcrR family transcriptional regulator, partial [Nostoc sp. CHAB 5715]|uniref:TetR/AcrR family transcriptional regulator n=1 Tax=Nostoc sp. CHAB 5715 TaxID=2780400 RepID=UPI001E419C92
MSSQLISTRQRLIQAALELFSAQGVSATTTRQIAEKAEVNEVTLFRNFGNKHGLLLAVLEESAAFKDLGESLVRRATPPGNVYQALKDYASDSLHALERVPEFVRSVVGEADQFPAENRRALGRGVTEANRYVAQYLATVIQQGHLNTYLPAEKLASLLNGMILGYAVIEFTSEFHELWEDRDDFLENLVELFLHGAMSSSAELATNSLQGGLITTEVADLPAT